MEMTEIADGLIDESKLTEEWFTEEVDGVTRQIRPTMNKWVRQLWSGSRCHMHIIGVIKLEQDVKSYYSAVHMEEGIMMPPVAMQHWGDFLVRYINSITKA